VVMIDLGGYGYYRGRLSRSGLAFILVSAVAWVAYAIDGASTFLSVLQFVSSFLNGHWDPVHRTAVRAYSWESETNDWFGRKL